MRYKSCAEWPEGTCPGTDDVTRVPEPDEAAAKRVCAMLEKDGFGGQGKVFPVKTWVEPEECKKRVTPFEYEIDQRIHDLQVEEGLPVTVDMSALEKKSDAEMQDERTEALRQQASKIRTVTP